MKKLIIVCENNLRQYGDFLSQLISLDDDKDGKIVGVKDREVIAQVWTEKQYVGNTITMSSEQYVLYIGNSKLIKDKRAHMINKYSEYGMHYGWLGKQGVLFVDNVLNLNDYDRFVQYANENQADVTKLIETKSDILVPEKQGESKGIDKILDPLKTIPAVIVNAPIHGLNAFSKMTNSKKIEDQEYSCLMLVFYLNGLSKFLGFTEE